MPESTALVGHNRWMEELAMQEIVSSSKELPGMEEDKSHVQG